MMTADCRYWTFPLGLFLALSIILPFTSGGAQAQEAKLKRFSVRDGLPHTQVFAITQDLQGFMWIGTAMGLYRHDGYVFTPYRHDPEDPGSLADDIVHNLHVDAQGVLWVSTYNGLDRYDPETDTFVHLRPDPNNPGSLTSDSVRVVLEDRAGMLWIGTTGGGLNKMDPETGAITVYRHDTNEETSLGSDTIRALYEDREGVLWVGTWGGGLNRFDPVTETFHRYRHDPADENSLISDRISAIHEDAKGHLWVGTAPAWAHRMDPDRPGHFTRYPRGQFWLAYIHQDVYGTLWVGSSNCCITRFDPDLDRFVGSGIPYEMGTTTARAIHESRDGVLWFGSNEGLFRFDPAPYPVEHIAFNSPTEGASVRAVYEDREGLLWVGGAGGLMQYDRTTRRTTWYQHDPDDPQSLGNNNVGVIYEDQAGTLWIGAGGVLNKMNRRTGTFIRYRHDPKNEASLMPGGIIGIAEDNAGTLWITTLNTGLSKMDRRTGTFTRFIPDQRAIQTQMMTHDGTMWLGLSNGMLRFNTDSTSFTHFDGSDTPDPRIGYDVHSVYEDREGRLWYGAPHLNRSINLLDTRTKTYSHIHAFATPIYSILGDEQGRLWFQAEDGLWMYDPAQGQLRSFEAGSGLTGWVTGSGLGGVGAHRSASGELFFGVAGGVKAFYPEQVLAPATSHPPQVALTTLQVSSDTLSPGPNVPINTAIWQAERITLPHDQNTFALTFAALDYHNPSANQYQFMLENHDETWREAGATRTARYVKVPPGEYVFRVKASNADGIWNEEGASVAVMVLPPWYQTTWAYLLYGLLFLVGAFAVDRIQRKRLIAKERERARERELEQAREIEKAHTELQQTHTHLKATQAQLIQAEKMASLGALTAGIAHEIKNPLNFVNNFADLNEELAADLNEELARLQDHLPPDVAAEFKETLSYIQVNASKIREQGQRADAIIQSMMQHASGGTGAREATDVNALVEEYAGLAYHGKRAQVPDFNADLQQDLDDAVGSVALIPQDIGRVLLNLCGNAFDAVHEKAVSSNGAYKPTVSISTRRTGDAVEIRVSDNGPGIPKAGREKIFEPFFTTKPTGSGTGLGLSLSYDIVTQGHGGTLTVESTEGEGATFVVTLPNHR